jgi:hypothetical protein
MIIHSNIIIKENPNNRLELDAPYVAPLSRSVMIRRNIVKLRYIIILASVLVTNLAQAETLLKDSVVCWSRDSFEEYISADEVKKKHMEEHSCGIVQRDSRAKIISFFEFTIQGKKYSVANIEMYYIDRGKERTDTVWTFLKNLNK